MPQLEFVKSHGIGNDFIIIDCLTDMPAEADLPGLSVRLCDRHYGIGADGLILVLPSERAEYRMQIINSDGSEAEMCGNGIRCFAKYLFDRGLAGDSMTVETAAGLRTVDVVAGNGKPVEFTVDMGAPRLEARDIPVTGYEGRVVSQVLEVDDTEFKMTCANMGNPHCVIFLDSADVPVSRVDLGRIGPKIETHPAFPKKTNVEFAQVVSDHALTVKVWERGAGITLACGTGACAVVVAGVLNKRVERRSTVHLPGGDLLIDWRESGSVYMTGPAAEVFTGKMAV